MNICLVQCKPVPKILKKRNINEQWTAPGAEVARLLCFLQQLVSHLKFDWTAIASCMWTEQQLHWDSFLLCWAFLPDAKLLVWSAKIRLKPFFFDAAPRLVLGCRTVWRQRLLTQSIDGGCEILQPVSRPLHPKSINHTRSTSVAATRLIVHRSTSVSHRPDFPSRTPSLRADLQ